MDPYKVLIEVMKTESFTRAAENLYTSQPSVSRDIKRLELKYNVKIFEFKSPYLKLTRDGEKLLQYALQRESIEQELWQNLTSESEIISGTLTIGSSYTYGEYLLSEQLTSLMQQYPKLHKSIQPRMDICFVREKGSGTRFYQEVGLSELKLNPYLIEINNIKIIKQMVEAGNGFAIISKSALHPEDYEKLMITTLNVKRHYYLAQHVDKYIGENIRAVIEMIMK